MITPFPSRTFDIYQSHRSNPSALVLWASFKTSAEAIKKADKMKKLFPNHSFIIK